MQKDKLRQFQRHDIRLNLTLRAGTFHRKFVQREYQIVFVRSACGVAQRQVAVAYLAQQLTQIASLRMRCVFQADTFASAGNGTIKFLKQRHKLRDKLGTFGTNILRFGGHLLVVNIQHLGIGLFVAFQQRIAVLQRLVVPDERRQIGLVVLRNGHIQKSATRIATFVYQIQIGRRHQHHRQQPDMV